MNVSVASTWYGLAQEQLKDRNPYQAIEFLRKAATNDHDNPEYALALATALAADGHTEEARQGLLRLRMSSPESGEINLNLARLAAGDGLMAEAIRYYHNALYGVWPADQLSVHRTTVRTELVRFLLSSGDTSRALSELLILSSDIPDKEQNHMDVARLFLSAGDPRHGLEQFRHVLQLNPKNADALEGAGKASFDLADYDSARRFLDGAIANGDKSDAAADLLQTSKLVLSKDPLVPRLATSERVRRLTENLNSASERLDSCIRRSPGEQASLATLAELREEMDRSIEEELTPANLRADAEGFRTGMNLIYRIEAATKQICQESSITDRALLLIARNHGVGEQ